MEHIPHRGITAAVAAAVAGAGLIAVTPAASVPALHPQQVEVRLTDTIADMFSALGTNVDQAFSAAWTATEELLGLNLPRSLGASADVLFSLFAMPANLLIVGAGEVNELLGGAGPNFIDFGLSSGFLPSAAARRPHREPVGSTTVMPCRVGRSVLPVSPSC